MHFQIIGTMQQFNIGVSLFTPGEEVVVMSTKAKKPIQGHMAVANEQEIQLRR